MGSLLDGYSEATGINDRGQVVGWSSNESGSTSEVFVLSNGKTTVISRFSNYGGDPFGRVYSINDRGQITGLSTSTGDAELYSKGRSTDLGSFRGLGSVALGINNRGEVVGYSTIVPSVITSLSGPPKPGTSSPPLESFTPAIERPFLYRDGKMIDLGTLEGSSGEATAINDRGEVVGYADTTADLSEHAFLYSRGRMFDLGSSGGLDSVATSINDRGQVVGWSDRPYVDVVDSFLYSNGKMVDLNSLIPADSGFSSIAAVSINNRGQFAADGELSDGAEVVLLLTPIRSTH